MADVFISYCRKDASFLERLLLTLKGYGLTVCDTCWRDQSVRPGQDWAQELQDALASARLGILMVTPDFLASDFIKQHELPVLMRRAAAGTLTLVPIPIRAVDWKAQPFSKYQSLLDPIKPLSKMRAAVRDDAYVRIGQSIVTQLGQARAHPTASAATAPAEAPMDQLARLQQQRSRLEAEGQAVHELTEQIKQLRRQLRAGRKLRQGDVLSDRYELEQQLGSGGFATVWRAMDLKSNRLVALKILHGQYSEDKSRRERFFRGARKMAGLKHEGIVTVLEQACQDGQVHFYVMEYLPGGDLEAAVLRGDVPREQWLPVLLQVGAALQYAHDKGLIHRDIKPSNILLDRQLRPCLCDFDLVRDADSTAGTKEGLGTFVYAAPECLDNGAEGDARADVFGLGMTFVFALSGKKLPLEVLRNAPGFIATLDLPTALAKALTRAVDWDRQKRTETVAVLCQEVQNIPKYPWAARSGQDDYGTWVEIEVKGVRARLRWIPPGSFMMGSPANEPERRENELQHRVTLTQGFWLGEAAVTQALWQAVMGTNPSHFKGADLPVETVSWDDAVDFLGQLNQGLPGLVLRLPTEAEWEYACRAGTETPFSFGRQIHSGQVNFDGSVPYNGGAQSEFRGCTVPVKSLPANAWGLHEMHGNVWEWCHDLMGSYSGGAVIDPQGPKAGALRVLRGGSWGNFGRFARAAYRYADVPGGRVQSIGVRLARGQ